MSRPLASREAGVIIRCVENVLSGNGTWIIPKRCCVSEGSANMVDPAQLRGYVLMNVTDPGKPLKMGGVDLCIVARKEREEESRLAPSRAFCTGAKRPRA